MLNKRLDLWLPTYLLTAPQRMMRRLRQSTEHTHLIFLVCDHFEPMHDATPEQANVRMQTWHAEYAKMQVRCRSEFGHAPLHSFFYPPHHGYGHLPALAEMAHDGLGEIELHYHHDGDTEASLERNMREALAEYNRWGLLLESGEQPRTSFGFIHGDWALGNSCDGQFCGVNDELTILQKLGCWADLTMPSGGKCQTRKINSIYYGKGSPHRPKAHNWGPNARVGKTDAEGLMMMQGPLGINFGAPSYPRIENASLTTSNWGRPDRIRKWIDCDVHVQGRAEWKFIKLHTHGAIEHDFDGLFGEKAMQMHRMLNEQYNDGKRFTLHYVTARQAYNIAKAAEHGCAGNPADYLDFLVPLPATHFYAANARHTLSHCTAERLHVSAIEQDAPVKLRSRVGPISSVQGSITNYEIDTRQKRIRIDANGVVEIAVQDGVTINLAAGASHLSTEGKMQRLEVNQSCLLSYQ
jgi:hypothetical protein